MNVIIKQRGLLSSAQADGTFSPFTLTGPLGTPLDDVIRGIERSPRSPPIYSNKGLDDHHKYLINGRQVFTLNNKGMVNPIVKSI